MQIKKITLGVSSALASGLLLLSPMAFAAPPERTDGFVCPVITTSAVLNSPNGAAIGEGHYSIIGPDVTVPIHATNDDGAGVPPGPHLMPGEVGYSPIWANQ